MSDSNKVTISEVEQALMQALKKAAEADYAKGDGFSHNSPLRAVEVFSSALQRVLTAQR